MWRVMEFRREGGNISSEAMEKWLNGIKATDVKVVPNGQYSWIVFAYVGELQLRGTR